MRTHAAACLFLAISLGIRSWFYARHALYSRMEYQSAPS